MTVKSYQYASFFFFLLIEAMLQTKLPIRSKNLMTQSIFYEDILLITYIWKYML